MNQLQIINHSNDDFDFPESVPEVAQDLIRKLLLQVRLHMSALTCLRILTRCG